MTSHYRNKIYSPKFNQNKENFHIYFYYMNLNKIES